MSFERKWGSVRTPSLFAGAVWATLNAAVAVGFPLLLFVFFARVTPAAQLGVAAAALAALELIKALAPQGLYETLLRPGAERDLDGAAATVLLFAGLFLSAGFAALVPALAAHWPPLAEAKWAMLALAPKLLFDLLVLQPQAALARRAAYRLLAGRAVIANLAAAVLGVAVALSGRPLWGLVAAYVAQSVLLFLLTALWSRALARPSARLGRLAPLAREAGFASAVRLAGAANSYLDQALLALFVPAAALARFNLGKRIETTLVTAQAAFSGVLFQPAFAVGDPQARAELIRRARALLTLACGLPVAVFAANPEPLVGLVFGPAWIEAAVPAALLALGGLARLYGGVHGALLSVSGRNGALLAYALGSAAAGAAVLAVAGARGLTVVAAALAGKNLAALFWAAFLTRADAPRPALGVLRDAVAPTAAMWAAAVLAGRVAASAAATPVAVFVVSALAAVAIGLWAARRGLTDLWRDRRPPAGEPAPCR